MNASALPTRPAADAAMRQQRIALSRRAWLEGHGLQGPVWTSPWLDRSWQRCLDAGMDPSTPVGFDMVSATDASHAMAESRALLTAAKPVIRSLARAMADTRYFAILTNAEGVVVDVNGPIDARDRRASAIARVGVDLSEASVGTTAIGAALAEREAVWLHRGEHFFNDNTSYSCAGAPVFGPDGHLLGMLDLTGIDVPERPALRHLVAQSARSIENALTLMQPHALLLRLNWPGQVLGSEADGLVCLDADGLITAANRNAVDLLGLEAGWQQVHSGDVFASPWEALFDLARSSTRQTEAPLWSGLRLQVMATPGSGAPAQRAAGTSLPLKDVEAALIRKAVSDAGGNVMEAAKRLGISRATIYRKLASPRE